MLCKKIYISTKSPIKLYLMIIIKSYNNKIIFWMIVKIKNIFKMKFLEGPTKI